MINERTAEGYCNGKMYARSGIGDQGPEVYVKTRVEFMRPRTTPEIQEYHLELLTKWNYELAIK